MRKAVTMLMLFSLCLVYNSCTNENSISEALDLNEQIDENTRNLRAEYIFPNISSIVSNPVVVAQMNSAWNSMKSNASTSGRSEYGFYIYYNHTSKTYYCGNIVQGSVTSGCAGTNASISLGRVTNNVEVCAFFHCHTTLQFCPATDRRSTGPSTSDTNFANSNKLPGIVYDYSASVINGGDSMNNAFKAYTFGPSQRPNMPY